MPFFNTTSSAHIFVAFSFVHFFFVAEICVCACAHSKYCYLEIEESDR